MATRKPRRTRKTSGETPAHTAPVQSALVPGPRGGFLKRGNPGNKGGPGRPRDTVREAALEALRRGPGVLAQIMDGETYVSIRETCPKCGHEPDPSAATAMPVVAKPGERVRAVEALDKLADEGTTLVVSGENVLRVMEQWDAALLQVCGPDVQQQVRATADVMWRKAGLIKVA